MISVPCISEQASHCKCNQSHTQCRKIELLIVVYAQHRISTQLLELKYTSEGSVLLLAIPIILPNISINVCVSLCAPISSCTHRYDKKKGTIVSGVVHQTNR